MKQFYLTKKIYSVVTTVLILLGLKEETIGTSSAKRTSAINFNTRNSFGIYSFKAALAFLLFASFSANAQIAVTITGDTNTTPNLATSYTSFANFVTALNSVTAVSGPVTATLAAGTSETAPVKGFNISTSTANVFTTTNTLTIVKAAGAATVINAGVGTSNGNTASLDGMLYLSGMDGVTIDGLTFTDGNSTNATVAMEFGIAFFKRAAGDGCIGNTVQNCTFNMQRINNAASSGPTADGSAAIEVLNSTAAAAITALTPTNGGTLATNGTNSNNRFYSNTINGGNTGIHLGGYAATVGRGPAPTATTFLGDLDNIVGASGLGNTISNYGGGAVTSAAVGIRANLQWSVKIDYNTINNNNGGGVNHATTLRGIYLQAGISANASCSFNNVTVSSGATTSALIAIENVIGSTAATNTIDINSNIIRLAYVTATSGTAAAILNSSTASVVNINNNNVQGVTSTSIGGTGTHLMIEGTSPATLNMTGNTVSNFTLLGASGTFRGLKAVTPSVAWNCTGNLVEEISYKTLTSTGGIDAIYDFSGAQLINISNNIIRNLSTPTTGTLNGIYIFTSSGTTKTCNNNEVYGFSTTAGGAGGTSMYGLRWSVGPLVANGNKVYSLNSIGGTSPVVNGLLLSVTGNIDAGKNLVYDLSSGATTPSLAGITLAAGITMTASNNKVGDLRTPAANAANPLIGINVSGGTTANLYYNTVYLAASSSGALFGSSAINATTGTTVVLRNNIFVNNSSTAGAGLAVAYRRSSTTLTSYGAASNNNDFYATSNIYTDGTNTDATIGAYKSRVSTRDNLSFSSNPTFLSTTGSNANFLKIDSSVSTQIESGGAAISGYADDFDGDTRSATTPDLGSDEFNGTSPAPSLSALSISPTGNQCTAVSRHITVTATTPSGTITGVVLNYTLNGVAQTGVTMTNTSGDIWEGDIPVASPVNAAVTWSVTATNSIPITTTLSGTGYQDEPLFGTIPTASTTPATVCEGSSTVLNAYLLKDGSPAASIGSGTNLTADTTQPTAFNNRWPSYRMQLLFTAAELSSSGLVAGNISAMAFNIATSGSAATNAAFTVNIGNTGLSVLGTSFNATTGYTNVFPSATYTHTASGLQTIPFSTPFAWDGTSNIIVDITMNGADLSNNSQTYYTVVGANRMLNTETVGTGTPTLSGNRLNVIFTGKAAALGTTVTWTDGTNNYSGNGVTVSPPNGTTTYTATIASGACSTTASTTVTPLALPSAPTATDGFRCGTGVVTGATVTSTTGLPTPTFRWYAALTGGTALQSSTSTSYTTSISSTTTLYVTEFNGSCESSPRTAITLTVTPPPTVTITPTTGNQVNCGTGPFNVVLTATSGDPGMTYSWTTSSPAATINSGAATANLDVSVTGSSDFVLTATPTDPSCAPIVITYPVSVYPLPSANVTTSATGVCPGTSATINSGLSAGNFTAQCITPISVLSTPPVSAVTLIDAGTIAVTQSSSASVDDGYWNGIPMGFSFNYFGTAYTTLNISTNGVVNFGATGSTQFAFAGPPQGFPSSANPANTIAVCARDMILVSGSVKYWTEGTAPNRKFIVQYANCPGYVTTGTGTGNNSVEAVFYETLGTVDIRVVTALNGTGGTVNAITKYIGLQDNTRTIGATAPNCSTLAPNFWNGVTTEITTPQAWKFSPPANYNVTWSTVGPGNVLTTVDSGLNHFTLTVTPSVTTTYNLSYTNVTTGCTNLPLSDQVTMTILDTTSPSTTAVASAATVCLGGSSDLSLTGNINSAGNTDGLTYQWQVSTDSGATWTDIAAATSATTTVTPAVPSSYQCLVKVCGGTAVASSPVTVGFTNVVDTTTPATRCGTGAVTLSATTSSPGASLVWYAAQTGGTALFTGSSYSPTVTATTTYYVAAETTGPACSSARVAVVATATTPPTITLTGGNSTAICTGFPATLLTDADVNYDTFTVTPNTTGSYTGGGVFTFNPTTTTTYTVTASQSSGSLCATTFTYAVTVNSTPANASASASVICVGGSVTLTGSTSTAAPGTVNTGGAGTGSIGGNEGNPYRSGNGTGNQIRTQMLVTASELTAQGMVAGNITSLAFTTQAASSGTLANFTIAIGHTSATALSTTFETSSVTSVFSQASFTPAASGLNVHTFQTPFNWDGTSNLLINVCQTNDLTGTATVTTETVAYNATTHRSGTTTGCTDTTGSSTATTRPIMQFGAQVGSTGPGGATYAWTSTPAGFTATGASVTDSPTVTTTYHVVATDPATGCSSAPASVTVTTQNTSAVISTPPASQTKCLGSTTTFTVAATGVNLTYQWRKGTTNLTNGGTISGATTATLTITGIVAGDAGDYNVVVGSDCGSPVTSADATLTIVTPLAGISASATTICAGDSVTLTENGGSATSWSWTPGGATTQAVTVSPSVTTNYVVTATTQVSGCTATANVTVNVNATPSAVTVTPTTSPVCSGTTAQVTASGGSFTSTYFADTFDVLSSQFTAATVSGTSTTTATLNTTYQTEGTGSVLFNTDGNSAAATYSLNSNVNLVGATTASLTFSHIAAMETAAAVDDFGTVEYSADGGTTWTTFTSANYTGAASAAVFSGSDVRFSALSYTDWTAVFTTATNQPTNALWKNETFTVPAAALTNQFKIRFRYTKDVSISYPGWFIDNVKISANGNTQYAWTTTPAVALYKDAALTQVYNVGTDFAPTVYAQPTSQTSFTATVANGTCTNSSQATVNVNPLPVITLANNITVCKGTGATITIPEINNNYSWSPSTGLNTTTGSTVLANPLSTTTYTVTSTNTSTFCQSTNQITVNVNDPGVIVTQPIDRIVAAGFSTSFSVAGSVGNTYGYQWQRKTGPTTYVNLSNDANYSGVTSAVLTVNNAGSGTATDGSVYRVLLTPIAPCSDIASNDAVLTVSTTGIATSPSNVNICLPTPSTATFTVATNGDEPYLVEWQVSTDGGSTYNTIELIDVNDTFLYMGPNTTAVPGLTFEHPLDPGNPNGTGSEFKVLNVSGITNPTTLKFKAIVNEVLPSAVATLSVSSPVTFSSNLSTTEVKRCKAPVPASATDLSVTTSGTVTSVEWRYDTTPGGTFSSVVTNNTPAGSTYVASSVGSTYSLAVTTNGSTPAGSYYYKAFVLGTATCGTTPLQSDMATITVVNPNVAISSSSASYCTPGSPVTLTASGASTYSWTSTPAGFTSSSDTASVTPTVSTLYSVTGTDVNGCTNSASFTVGVGTSFTVAASATPNSVCPSAAVALNAVPTAAGGNALLINTIPYQFNAVAGTFTPLSGTTVSSGLVTDDDTMSATLTPGSGFSFNYGGTSYTNFRVSSNGQLIFGGAGTQAAANDLTTTTSTQRAGLAPLWDDQQLTAGINYQVSGTAPNRVLTVEWLNMEWNYQSNTPVISYQVKLYETTNVIEYVYRQESTAYNAGTTGGASIGLLGTASGNYISLQDTSASPVLSTTTSKNDITAKPATGQIYRFTPVTPITYTYAWTSTPAGFSAATAAATANPTVSTAYSVTATSNQGCTATNSASVTVDSTPAVVTPLAATLNLCAGATATFTVTATSATPLTYQWKKGGTPLTNGSGISGATTATLTITGTTPANSGSYTVDVTNCTTVTSTATVLTVNPLPTATVSGTVNVCQNDAQPLVTFTGAAGTAPYTFTYKLNGGANQTISTTSGNSVTIAVPTTTAGSFAYSLVSVQDSSSSACTQNQTGTATVVVNALPVAATLSSDSPVCAGNTLNLTSTVAPLTGYTLNSNSGVSFIDISTTGTSVGTAADDSEHNLTIPSFTYNGVAYTTARVGNNGILVFGTTTGDIIYSNSALPQGIASSATASSGLITGAGNSLAAICAAWDDMTTSGTVTTSIRTQTIGTKYIVQWTNEDNFNATGSGTITFQIQLDSSDGKIHLVYPDFTYGAAGFDGGASATIGLNYSATSALQYSFNTASIVNGQSITFTPAAYTYAWTGPNGFSSAVQNPSIANATVAATGTYTLEITNSNGCKATSTVNAVVGPQPQWFLDADGDHWYTGTAISSCTSPGAGYTTTGLLGGGDCNDAVAAINPGAAEICYNNIDDNCNLTQSEGCAPVVVYMVQSYHNSTLPSLATAIPAVVYTYPGATNIKYRFSIKNLMTNVTAPDIIQTSRYVTIPASIHSYNADYSIKVSAVINDEVVAYVESATSPINPIVVHSPVVQLITLNTASCGATLASLTTTITANAGLNATGYTFRIRLNDANPSPTYAFSQSATRFVSANSFTGFPLQYSSSYKVAVQYTFNDPVTNLPVESGYGAECTVNTPSIPVTTMASPTCGSQVTAMNANISAAAASYATGYQFRIRLFGDNGPTPTYNTSAVIASRFSSLTAFTGQGPLVLDYNTEYAISVRYSILNGSTTVWSEYGPDCKVKTPFFPTTSLVPSQCGLATPTSLTQQLNITPYPGFPNYKVKLDEISGEDVVNSQEIIVTYSYFRLNQFSIAQLGKNYNVSVAIKQNGVFGPYDTACDLFTVAAGREALTKVPFKATAYPNPFANNFMLDVKTMSESAVNIKVYDMIGRLIEQRDVRVSDMANTTIGDRYPSGVYNVVVSQEDSVQTVRVVKR